jgi:hypothetical protein
MKYFLLYEPSLLMEPNGRKRYWIIRVHDNHDYPRLRFLSLDNEDWISIHQIQDAQSEHRRKVIQVFRKKFPKHVSWKIQHTII